MAKHNSRLVATVTAIVPVMVTVTVMAVVIVVAKLVAAVPGGLHRRAITRPIIRTSKCRFKFDKKDRWSCRAV